MASWHERLTQTLTALCDAAADLTASATAQHDAMRSADPQALDAANRRHAEALHAIATLEHERVAAVREGINASPRLRTMDLRGATPTLEQLTASLSPTERTPLLEVAARLRESLKEARQQQTSVGEAAGRLDQHMQGITHQVRRRLAGPTTYQRGGRYASGAPVAIGLDMTR